jgi:hypothetical protein
MMLYQPLVSLLMLFAATSGVAASATPVRRGGNGGYYPPPSVPAISQSQCNTAPQCCQQTTNSENPILGVLPDLANANLPVGLDCVDIIGTNTWWRNFLYSQNAQCANTLT